MDDSTVIELGILAVLVFVVTHPVAPVVDITNNIPAPQQQSQGDTNAIAGIANGIISVVGTIAKLI
jgi:hypothetical protein